MDRYCDVHLLLSGYLMGRFSQPQIIPWVDSNNTTAFHPKLALAGRHMILLETPQLSHLQCKTVWASSHASVKWAV
jgi:hypothetical protein